jgi:cholesterol transport system auxiliary component
MSPKGRPEGESGPKRVSAEGSSMSAARARPRAAHSVQEGRTMSPAVPTLRPQRRRALVLLALAPLVPGCSLTRPPPAKRRFLLEPPMPAAGARTQPYALRIGPIGVAAPYRDRAIVFRTADLKYESDFYNEFFVSPAAMIAEATGRALVASRAFARVIPAGVAGDEGDFSLEGFVDALYADGRVAGKAEAEVSIGFFLTRAAFPGGVAWSGSYRERTPIAGTQPDAVADAMNASLGRILVALARDLAGAELPKP